MTVLSKSVLRRFYTGLEQSRKRSSFDSVFLTEHSLEALEKYDTKKWLTLFGERLSELKTSEFDWIKLERGQNDWSVESSGHTNYYWYHLARHAAKISGKHFIDFLFSGVVIGDNDRHHLEQIQQFCGLIYSDDFKRIEIINRIFLTAVTQERNTLASYDEEGEYPLSLAELAQIQERLQQENTYYIPFGISTWEDFRNNYFLKWQLETFVGDFSDLLYPLYDLTRTYFSELGGLQGTPNGSTVSLLKNFYKNSLAELSCSSVAYFYSQTIQEDSSGRTSLHLVDALLKLNRTTNLADVLDEMLALAQWIAVYNPAMVIEDANVQVCYRQALVGPFVTKKKLSDELSKLLRNRQEISDEERLAIQMLRDQLLVQPGPDNSEQILSSEEFNQIKHIFALRDEYIKNAEPFIVFGTKGIINGSYHYVYHRAGINLRYVYIAQLLDGCGILKHFGIDDYFQLLMPSLAKPYDQVSGLPLSSLPFSHYVHPDNDPTYLICLDNSENNYHLNRECFYNVNSESVRPLTINEYTCVQVYAAFKFHRYSRVPKFTQYKLHASTLEALVVLVNRSLNYEAIKDGEGYVLRKGFSRDPVDIENKVIEYIHDEESVSYQVKDSWDFQKTHQGTILFSNATEKHTFAQGSTMQRLLFILNTALKKGHARSNLPLDKYYEAYVAYTEFRAIYWEFDESERNNLNNVSMRYAGSVRTFKEIWADGFPDCMSSASKWFSTLVLDYLPEVQFRFNLEHPANKHNEYLSYARRDSQRLYRHHLLNNLTTTLDELVKRLTHVSAHHMLADLATKSLQFLGVDRGLPLEPDVSHMLRITDSGKIAFGFFSPRKKASLLASKAISILSSSSSGCMTPDTDSESLGSSSGTSSRADSTASDDSLELDP